MIESISIKTKSGKEILLTLDEAKELREELNGLFGSFTVSPPIYPQWTPVKHPDIYPPSVITCGGNDWMHQNS